MGTIVVRSPIRFRPQTDDFGVYQNVVLHNEYRLPSEFEKDDVIIDIGAHVGCFVCAAYLRGARTFYVYEPEPKNSELLQENLLALPELQGEGDRRAVWRSDREVESLYFTRSELEYVSGGGNVLLEEGESVAVVQFDQVIEKASEFGRRRIRLVKLDCEGSEFPILLTSQKLHMIDAIYGEYHEIGGVNMQYVRPDQVHPTEIPEIAKVDGYKEYTVDVLVDHLEQAGFSVWTEASSLQWLGKFWAERNL